MCRKFLPNDKYLGVFMLILTLKDKSSKVAWQAAGRM